MPDRVYKVIALAATAFIAGCGTGSNTERTSVAGVDPASSHAAPQETGTPAEVEQLPLLAPLASESIERDTPPAVRDRIVSEQQAVLKRASDAARLPMTVEAGCEPTGIPGATLGPPPPKVTPRILGHHVEIEFSYPKLPRSPACRPAVLDVVVYSGQKASSSFNNAGGVGHYLLRGPRGRVVLDVPWFGQPPYHVSAGSTTIAGRRGRAVESSPPCAGSRGTVVGCLPGYRPGLHTWQLPAPVLPLRGVDRDSLEATLRYVLAAERSAPLARSSRCPTLRICEVAFFDPSFPDVPYRVRYRIAGEQIPGCWMGIRGETVDELPYEDAGLGRLQIAACVSWLR